MTHYSAAKKGISPMHLTIKEIKNYAEIKKNYVINKFKNPRVVHDSHTRIVIYP